MELTCPVTNETKDYTEREVKQMLYALLGFVTDTEGERLGTDPLLNPSVTLEDVMWMANDPDSYSEYVDLYVPSEEESEAGNDTD